MKFKTACLAIRFHTRPKLKTTERRCIEYSPLVAPNKFEPKIEMYEFEAEMWRGTFAAMGGLKASGMEDVKTFTRINKQPYHCPSIAREFSASYGPLARIEMDLPKHQPKQSLKDDKYIVVPIEEIRHHTKNTTVSDLLPYVHSDHVAKDKPYIPLSAVRITLGKTITDNIAVICDWLEKRFGSIVFVIKEDSSHYMIVFERMKSSFDLVNAGINPAELKATWIDEKFYNFGHYNFHKRYQLTLAEVDKLFRQGIPVKRQSHSSNSYRLRIIQQNAITK